MLMGDRAAPYLSRCEATYGRGASRVRRGRLREGLDITALGARLGVDVRATVSTVLDELLAAGCLEWLEPERRLRVAEGSILVISELLVRMEGALANWRERAEASEVADAEPGAQGADRAILTGR